MKYLNLKWPVIVMGAVCMSCALMAQTAEKSVSKDSSIKNVISHNPAPLFEKQRQIIDQRRAGWYEKAAQATPKLIRTTKTPVSLVKVEKDAARFQGWKTVAAGPVDSVYNRPLAPGESFILDFGEHLTGQFFLSLRQFDVPVDAPVRLAFIFGETPAELAEPFDPYSGGLTRAWLQDEVVNFDDVPQTTSLPRRYAFRYVKITVVSASLHGRFGFSNFKAEAISSADATKVAALSGVDPDLQALDTVSLRTLRDCMQTVFEDGPKRDRRLWLGDLRLQAQANYVTFHNLALVKRSLYLLAGAADDKGLVGTCVFERPQPVRGGNAILDYTALFAPTVLEYFEASGDRETTEDLWPLVLKQLDFTLEPVNAEGLFISPQNWWLFIDWHPTLDKQAPEHAIVLYGLRATLKLAQLLGKQQEVQFIEEIIPHMETAARKHLWDESQNLFVSGPKREVSWASQAWMVLAQVPTQEQGQKALLQVMQNGKAIKPVTPYMNHYMVEALLSVGLREQGFAHLRSYWGGMLEKGADTFWEVYIPGDDSASPYQSHLINSYCHAWSCTPTYFIRKYRQ